MKTIVLIILVYAGNSQAGPAATSIPGFASMEQCQAASDAVKTAAREIDDSTNRGYQTATVCAEQGL